MEQSINAPCYKANAVSNWFHKHEKEFSVIQWPSKSTHMNPIEHLCDVVEVQNFKIHCF